MKCSMIASAKQAAIAIRGGARTIATLLTVFCVSFAGVSGCSKPATGARSTRIQRGTVVAVIGPSKMHPQCEGLASAFSNYWAGIDEVTVVEAAMPADDPAAGSAAIQELERRSPAGIAVFGDSAQALRASVDALSKHGRIVVTIGPAVDDSRVYGQVRVDATDAARLAGDHLSDIVPLGAGYIVVYSEAGDAGGGDVFAVVSAAARRAAGITLLDQVDLPAGMADGPADARRAISAAIRRFRSARIFIALDSRPWLDSSALWFAEMRDVNQALQIVPLSTSPSLWEMLRKGEASALIGPNNAEIGRAAARLIYRGLTGGEVPAAVVIPPEFIRAPDLEAFTQRFEQAGGSK